MKQLLIVLVLLLAPFSALADFQNNLSYGSKGDDVVALQEFLTTQGVFSGQATGNFYSITLAAVKLFQSKEGITPVSGFVGPITRGVINGLLAVQAPDSEGDATTTQPVVDLSTLPPTVPPAVVYVPVYTTPVSGQTQNSGTITNNPQPMPDVQTPVPDHIQMDFNSPVSNPLETNGPGSPFLITVTPYLSDGSIDQTALIKVTSTAPWWFPHGGNVCSNTTIVNGKTVFVCPLQPGVQFNALGNGYATNPGTYAIQATWDKTNIVYNGTVIVQPPANLSEMISSLQSQIAQEQNEMITDISNQQNAPIPGGDANARAQQVQIEDQAKIARLQSQLNILLALSL